jgi:hypothetical protein
MLNRDEKDFITAVGKMASKGWAPSKAATFVKKPSMNVGLSRTISNCGTKPSSYNIKQWRQIKSVQWLVNHNKEDDISPVARDMWAKWKERYC